MERSRYIWSIGPIENFVKDLRYAFRILTKDWPFTAAVLSILALGIGASTAVFSAVDAVLIHPLAVSGQSRLVLAWKRDALSHNQVRELSTPEFRDWQGENHVFSGVAALPTSVYGYGYTVTGAGEPFQVESARVSASFFPVLGVRPELGRVFNDDEDRPGAPRTVVLSHSLWRNHFNSDPALVGRQLTMSGDGYTVVGVMPPDFDFPSGVDVWTALSTNPYWVANRGADFLQVLGRLKPGVTLSQAQADLDSIIANIAHQYPETKSEHDRAVVTPLTSYVLGSARPALFLLMAAALLLLLIACTNVAGLLLARAISRKKEIAVRAALGAGRTRLVRQLLTESLLLAVVGGGLGTALAVWLVAVFKRIAPADVPRIADAHLNGAALGFACFMMLVSATLFGLAPALAASKIDLAESFKDAGARTSASGGTLRLRSALIVAEIAITLVLAIGASLVTLSFRSLERVDLGFDPRNVVTAEVSLRGADYGTPEKRRALYRQLIERLESHPEVAAAGMDLVRPLQGTIGWDVPYQAEGQPVDAVPGNPVPNFEIITPHYFRALKIRLIGGREFSEADTPNGAPVVIVSQRAARQFFGGQDAVGKRIKLGAFDPDSPWLTVVGVVGDARYRAVDDERLNVYVPYTQRAFPVRYVMIRVNPGTPIATAGAILRKELAGLDGTQAVSSLTTSENMVARALARPRFSMILLASFALLAAFLATIGIYGIVSFSVSERTREIGIRMALGAGSTRILAMVTASVVRLASAGIVLGLAMALASTPLMSGLLYGVHAASPLVFAAVSVLLLLAAVAAAIVPARRAAKVEPASALRSD